MQQTFTAIAEKCHDSNLFVGYVRGMPGAHSQAETLDELHQNLREVIDMLLADGEQATDIGLTIDELLQTR